MFLGGGLRFQGPLVLTPSSRIPIQSGPQEATPNIVNPQVILGFCLGPRAVPEIINLAAAGGP